MSSTIEYLRDFLIRYEYPAGDMHDDSCFSDVFLAPNRPFLLAWAMEVYLGEKGESEGLLERLVEMGLVNEAFVRGHMKPDREVFKNMFQFIRVVKEPPAEMGHALSESVEIHLSKMDKRFQEYLLHIESELVPEPVKLHQESQISKYTTDETFQETMLQFDSELQQMEETGNIIKNVNRLDNVIKLVFPLEFPSTVAKCKMLLEEFHQYIKDVTTISSFLKGLVISEEVPEISESNTVSFLEDVMNKLVVIREIQNK